MSPPAVENASRRPRPSHLHLVTCATGTQAGPHLLDEPPAVAAASSSQATNVLVAGANERIRSSVLDELNQLLAPGTRFIQAGETWEVIARAPTSSMVVIAGDLGDVSAKSLLRLLSRRYPTLPVLAVGERAPGRAAADVNVAGG